MAYLKVSFKDGMLVEEVASVLTIHPDSVRRLARRGRITPTFIGHTMVFERADVEAFKALYNPMRGSGKITAEIMKGGAKGD